MFYQQYYGKEAIMWPIFVDSYFQYQLLLYRNIDQKLVN